ncbi:MAG: sensor histidine kinase [Phenylobacterium sp.]|nr:MAG: sensor histidine kinase [Phenylobacterium sp.]
MAAGGHRARRSAAGPCGRGPGRFVGLRDGALFDGMTETCSKPAQCGPAALALWARGRRANVPRGSLTDKIALGGQPHGAAVSWPHGVRRSTMHAAAISPSEASPEPAPLLLVGEISHRVLNEFTHAIATLSLARAETTDLGARRALAAAEGRLRAYADVHRALRPPPSGRPCDLGAYLETVCAALSGASLRDRGVRLTLIPSEVTLAAERCWRVALITAELVNNAVRHAFDEGGGRIVIEVESLGPTILLRVADDGRPASSSPPRGWGRSIVESLTHALGGRIEWLFEPSGTEVVLRFPSDFATLA